MKILVTGGSGYLGVHVCRFFGATDFSRRTNHDIMNSGDLEPVKDYDVVIHLAAHLEKDAAGAERCFETNVQGTANVLKHMQPHSVFIYASTKDVYGANAEGYEEVPETCPVNYSGQTALEWSKLMGELYVEYYAAVRNLRACIFRMSTIYARASEGNEYGFVTHYVESVKRHWPIEVPARGLAVRDILHVQDFSEACRAFIDSSQPFGLYNLGGGKDNSASLYDLIETIGKLIAIEPIIENSERIPPPVPMNYVSDLTRIRDELRWQPAISIEQGLRDIL